jgi:hypothetical protein
VPYREVLAKVLRPQRVEEQVALAIGDVEAWRGIVFFGDRRMSPVREREPDPAVAAIFLVIEQDHGGDALVGHLAARHDGFVGPYAIAVVIGRPHELVAAVGAADPDAVLVETVDHGLVLVERHVGFCEDLGTGATDRA